VNEAILKVELIKLFHEKISMGYSPQVWFGMPMRDKYGKFSLGEKIDWKTSINSITRIPWLNFFRTPEFEVYGKGKKVYIIILQPDKVTAKHEFNNIRAVYAKFRRRLKVVRKAWGEVSGAREFHNKLQNLVKHEFIEIMKEPPGTRVEQALDLVNERLKNKGMGVLSQDRLKRIIYTKGSVENK